MKVISIIQPWATLIALGEKKFETRSWRTKYKGSLAIHSSKKIDRTAFKRIPIVQTLKKHGIVLLNDLPTGMILATCNLEGCFEVIEDKGDSAVLGNEYYIASGNEYHLGDFNKGRYGWLLSNVNVLDNLIAAKGQLGLWNYHELE
ncbi:ASCH domain-containing protein [Alkalihalobacillus sp. AL-G]|uniref:ASCH domain-containing protein n=1 Tax=Alkalihalobacillus sp. AL-G TaxID=2926399 RepID=UPI00272A3ADD|nr:ASCH domain-containing protein [Alkalihalobacillus sp. AL-G]WLD95448.1 ASCH domain-containing protein [Alkalihalobacillus sp. AL-G]